MWSGNWQRNGKEKIDWILENHHPEPLDEAQQAEFRRILQAVERELE
jgi:hypothetical protein